jgi:hypothetical protein
VEAQADAAAPKTLAHMEPEAPVAPALALAAAETPSGPSWSVPEFRTAERSGEPVFSQPTSNPSQPPITAAPAVRSKEVTEHPSASPALRRQVPETFGHAPDHNWLQGLLEKHHAGHWELRYCDAAREDKWGGKVILADDSRLAGFKAGDLILVEGELLPEQGPKSAWRHFLAYRIKNIWLAEAKGSD